MAGHRVRGNTAIGVGAMSDGRWDAILESPYEDRGDRRNTEGRSIVRLVATIVVASAIGGASGWVMANAGGDSEPIAGSTTTTFDATTTTSVTSVSDAGFLVGYTPVGDTAYRAIGSFQTLGKTYIVVSEVVGVNTDRTTVTRVSVGTWDLETDEGIVPVARDIRAALSPGLSLLEFETTATATGLRLVPAGETMTAASCTRCEVPISDTSDGDIDLGERPLPTAIEDPGLAFQLDSDVALVVDKIDLAEDWGLVSWETESTAGGRASVDFFVTYVGSAEAGSEFDTSMAPEHQLPPRFGQSQTLVPPEPATAGVSRLARFGPPVAAEADTVRMILRWTVTWVFPEGDPILILLP